MESLEGHSGHPWNPLSFIGITNPLFEVNLTILINTWIILGFIFLVILLLRPYFARPNSIVYYMVNQYVEAFQDLTEQALGYFHYKHSCFVTVLFTFILLCNWIAFIPGLEEPTADLNTTLALGLTSFFYKDIYTIITLGWRGYLHEFITPFFVMLPLNVIGHFSKVLSLSFRLFGNILGGSIITNLFFKALSNSIVFNILGLLPSLLVIGFFIFFEGLIQAYVFSMLAITYLGMALQHQEGA